MFDNGEFKGWVCIRIQTDWNLKSREVQSALSDLGIRIQTDWNLKEDMNIMCRLPSVDSNLDRLEFKVAKAGGRRTASIRFEFRQTGI